MPTKVPDTNTFTLQDVVSVIGCAGNLQACCTFGVDAYYDPVYKGSKNALYCFRNYTLPYISCSPTSCRFHYNGPAYDNPITTVSYAKGTYTYAWAVGTHFSYSKTGDAFTVTCNGQNVGGSNWTDTLTFTLTGGLTATFSITQFYAPN